TVHPLNLEVHRGLRRHRCSSWWGLTGIARLTALGLPSEPVSMFFHLGAQLVVDPTGLVEVGPAFFRRGDLQRFQKDAVDLGVPTGHGATSADPGGLLFNARFGPALHAGRSVFFLERQFLLK